MVVDCIPFFNELDILEIRLNELKSVVDVFVICEATLTFSNKPKPLYFNDNRHKFKDFPIEHVVIDSYNGIKKESSWSMDRGQKKIGLKEAIKRVGPEEKDLVIVTDCDEIPKSTVVESSKNYNFAVAALQMPLYYYWLNCRCSNKVWNRAKIVRFKKNLTHKKIRYGKSDKVFRNSGWHYSFMNDISGKIDAYAHQEYNNHRFTNKDHITRAVNECIDLFDRDYRFTIETDKSNLPIYVQKNIERFKPWIYQS